ARIDIIKLQRSTGLDELKSGTGRDPKECVLIGDHHGFNLVSYMRREYGLRQTLGPVDISYSEANGGLVKLYGEENIVVGSTVNEVKSRIELLELQALVRTLQARIEDLVGGDSLNPSSAQLLESYGDFNVVLYGNRVYGIHQILGPIDVAASEAAELQNHYSEENIVVGTTRGEVRARIDIIKLQRSTGLDELKSGTGRDPKECVLIGDHHGFNLVSYMRREYGLRQTLGPVDISYSEANGGLVKLYGEENIVVGSTVNEVKSRIELLELQALVRTLQARIEDLVGGDSLNPSSAQL